MKSNLMFSFSLLALILIGPVLIVHAQVVSEDDLVIYYSFNQDTLQGEDIVDVSGNGNDGLLHGDNLNIVAGKVGECMEFPGNATQYISVREHMYKDPIDEITLAAWAKTDVRGMIASWDRSEFFRFAVGDDVGANAGTTFVAFDTCCGIHDWFGETEVADDKWHHLVATFDGKEKRIYVDGELDAKIAAPSKVIGAGAARFGFIGIGSEAAAFDAAVGPTWAFNGLIDEFLLFHRALSEKEVESLAKGQSNPFAVEPTDKLTTIWAEIKDTK
jgi:hypothetical protein